MGVLKKNESDDEFKFMISIMEEVHYVRMNRSVNKEIEFTKDIFERVVKKLENKNKRAYSLFLPPLSCPRDDHRVCGMWR